MNSVQNELHKHVVEELKKNRYGDQPKRQRAMKANRLPPGTAYMVSAIPVEETEPLAGPPGEGQGAGCGRGAGRGRGAGCGRGMGRSRGGGRSIEDSSDEEYADTSILHLDYLGADSEEKSSDSSEEENDK